MATTGAEQRRYPRVPVDGPQSLQVEMDGQSATALVCDISEGGIGFTMPQGSGINTDDVLGIGLEQVINLRGRVRWIGSDPEQPQQQRLGVQFESVIVHPKRGDEVQEMVDAWMQVSESYSTFDSFLRILDLIDNDILDGKLDSFPDAVGGIALWMEKTLGDLNLWHVIDSPNAEPDVHVLVDLSHPSGESYDTRRERVMTVAASKVTKWYDRRPYVYGEEIVIEFFGPYEGKIDLLHKLAVMLGKRVRTWTKLISKNIALDALSEELARRSGKLLN